MVHGTYITIQYMLLSVLNLPSIVRPADTATPLLHILMYVHGVQYICMNTVHNCTCIYRMMYVVMPQRWKHSIHLWQVYIRVYVQ